jgi:phage terminase large subunit
LKRWNVLVCHRRFGKTVLCIAELVDKALRCEKERPRFAYFAPLFRQAKQAAWDYLKLYTAPIPGVRIYESELRVDLPNGARIQLFGSDNPDAVRGIYLDGVVLDEYAQMPPRMFTEVIRPALTDRQGWAIFIGTPHGRNSFCELYENAVADEDWYGQLYRASESDVIPAEELAAARKQMSDDQYNQEFECSFEAAIPGAYYGVLMREAMDLGRICTVSHDPAVPVETWWDLGIGDPTSIWFVQRVGPELHAIDYYEANGEPIAHYAGVLQDKQQQFKYRYSAEILPHDANGKSLQTGQRLADTLKAITGREPVVMPLASVNEGIETARSLIPRFWFDKDRCARGIECLRQYRQDWDDKRQAFRTAPLHDWTSHGADAFRTGAMHKPASEKWMSGPAPAPKLAIA